MCNVTFKSLLACAAMGLVGPAMAQATTANLLTNPGAEAGNLTGWTVGGDSNPGVDSGSFDSGINPRTGSFDFYGGTGDLGSLTQTVSLSGVAGLTLAAIDAGNLKADVSFWQQSLNQGNPSDHSDITLRFADGGDNTLGTVTTPSVDSHDGTWKQGQFNFDLPAGTRSIDYTMNFRLAVGSDNDSFIDDNSLIIAEGIAPPPTTVPLPAAAWMGLSTLTGLDLLRLRKRRSAST